MGHCRTKTQLQRPALPLSKGEYPKGEGVEKQFQVQGLKFKVKAPATPLLEEREETVQRTIEPRIISCHQPIHA
jgi:hypothetical protein